MASVISGLGSGIDLQSIVASLMNAERAPAVKMNSLRMAALSSQTAWADLSTRLGTLATTAKSLTSGAVLSSAATSSDPTTVTASAGAGAQVASVGVKVVRLATSQQLSSGPLSSTDMLVGAGEAVLSAGLGSIGASGVTVSAGTTTGTHVLTVTQASSKAVSRGTQPPALAFTSSDLVVGLADGGTRAVTLGSYATPSALVDDLRTQLTGIADVHLVAGHLQISSRDEGSGATLALSGAALAELGLAAGTTAGTDALVSLDGGAATRVTRLDAGTTVDLGTGVTVTTTGHLGLGTASMNLVRTTSTTTLADLATSLGTSGSPLSAAIIDSRDGSGTPNRLILSAVGTGSAGAVTINATGISVLAPGQLSSVVSAADAEVEIGGVTVTRSSNKITDLLPGVTLGLVRQTAAGAGPVTVEVGRDSTATASKVTALVDGINAVLNAVKTQTAYSAGTNKGGPLSGESGARSVSSSLMDLVASAAGTGQLKVLSQLGIQTTRSGTLSFDSATLATALQKDPDGVASLLSSFATSVESFAKQTSGPDGLVTAGAKSAGSEARRRQDQIDSFEVRMTILQKSYSAKFSALDVALGQLKAQQSALASAINSLPLQS